MIIELKMSRVSPKKRNYQKTDPLTHIRKRPDTYVGSKKLQKLESECVADISQDIPVLINRDIKYIPALLRIFVKF